MRAVVHVTVCHCVHDGVGNNGTCSSFCRCHISYPQSGVHALLYMVPYFSQPPQRRVKIAKPITNVGS